MIKYIEGDLFESNAQVLVNTVNTEGVMGKGIAKTFKYVYPEMFEKYKNFCDNNQFNVGMLYLYKSENKWILNFPTKTQWKKKSEIKYIEDGLKKFAETYKDKNINSIAFPQLGCGNGNLNWADVKPVMEKYLGDLPIDIEIYVRNFDTTPDHLECKEIKKILEADSPYINYYEFLEYFSDEIFGFIGDECLKIVHSKIVDGRVVTSSDISNAVGDVDVALKIFNVICNMPYLKKVTINNEAGIRIRHDLGLRQGRLEL